MAPPESGRTSMLYRYRTPGVYFEWLDSPPAIGRRRTDIAGFVGIAERGPLHRPVKVESRSQFTSTFGGHIPQAFLAYAVDGFFANGGRTCWVVRVADPVAAQPASLYLLDASGQVTVELVAESPGMWGRDLLLTATATSVDLFTLTINLLGGGQELWRALSLNEGDERYIAEILNNPNSGSRLVRARQPSRRWAPAGANGLEIVEGQVRSERMSGGDDGLATLRSEHFDGQGYVPAGIGDSPDYEQPWGLTALKDVDEVSIVAMPDIMPRPPRTPAVYKERPVRCDDVESEREEMPTPGTERSWPPVFSEPEISALQRQLIAHCERMKDRMAILDPRPEEAFSASPLREIIGWRNQFNSSYGALYFPWIKVLDPLLGAGGLSPVPPSGHVAGVYARGDWDVGVHKPPANERLDGIQDITIEVGDVAHGTLNDKNVNVIRPFSGRGLRIAGARTLNGEDPEWRYVNVRRLLLMIEEALTEDLAWAVFEPNNPPLWREVERVARAYLDRLWRRGMLDGATADDAYFARCDAQTNPQHEVDAGRLFCLIGVQPPWPAEFVIVRIGKMESGTEIVEMTGVSNG